MSHQPTATGKVPVSVLIPAYNRAGLLGRALASVNAQQGIAPSEVIVVDDGSVDGTSAVALAHDARLVHHETRQGLSAARNTALDAASQPWTALLDSDDEWLPHHLSTLWGLTGDHVIVAGTALGIGPGDARRLYGHPAGRLVVLRSPAQLLFPDNFVPASGTMFRRDVAGAAGGFDSLLRGCEDLDLWIRMLEHGTGVISPVVTLRYYVHSGQVSADAKLMAESRAAVLGRYNGRPWSGARFAERSAVVGRWDEARSAQADGRLRTAVATAAPLLRPPRLWALFRLLVWRYRLRRRTRGSADVNGHG